MPWLSQFFNKYRIVQLLFCLNILLLLSLWQKLWFASLNWPVYLLIFTLLCLSYHYFLNFLHLASHKQLSKNYRFNQILGHISAIFGGLTYPDFVVTHFLHHKNPNHPKLDPDSNIASGGSLWTIPFRIWYHDKFFLSQSEYRRSRLCGYLLDRLLQVAFLIFCFSQGKFWFWVTFWLLPLLLVGFGNGLFLFYFPHFVNQWENSQRAKLLQLQDKVTSLIQQIKAKNLTAIPIASNQKEKLYSTQKPKIEQQTHLTFIKNFCQLSLNLFFYSVYFFSLQLILLSIDIARVYHKEHHDNIGNLRNYFPIYSFLQDFYHQIWLEKLQASTKYTNLKY